MSPPPGLRERERPASMPPQGRHLRAPATKQRPVPATPDAMHPSPARSPASCDPPNDPPTRYTRVSGSVRGGGRRRRGGWWSDRCAGPYLSLHRSFHCSGGRCPFREQVPAGSPPAWPFRCADRLAAGGTPAIAPRARHPSIPLRAGPFTKPSYRVGTGRERSRRTVEGPAVVAASTGLAEEAPGHTTAPSSSRPRRARRRAWLTRQTDCRAVTRGNRVDLMGRLSNPPEPMDPGRNRYDRCPEGVERAGQDCPQPAQRRPARIGFARRSLRHPSADGLSSPGNARRARYSTPAETVRRRGHRGMSPLPGKCLSSRARLAVRRAQRDDAKSAYPCGDRDPAPSRADSSLTTIDQRFSPN